MGPFNGALGQSRGCSSYGVARREGVLRKGIAISTRGWSDDSVAGSSPSGHTEVSPGRTAALQETTRLLMPSNTPDGVFTVVVFSVRSSSVAVCGGEESSVPNALYNGITAEASLSWSDGASALSVRAAEARVRR